MNIKVRDLLGDNYSIEDAILLREIIRNNLDQGVILDFDGYDRVPSTFLINLFTNSEETTFLNKLLLKIYQTIEIIQE